MNKKRLIQQRYPAGMQYINWLQSTDDSFIDTGIQIKDGNEYRIKTRFIPFEDNAYIFGCGERQQNAGIICFLTGGYIYLYYKDKFIHRAWFTYKLGEMYDMDLTVSPTSTSIILNGVSHTQAIDSTQALTERPFYIFGSNGSSTYTSNCRFYNFEIYKNSVKIRDFRPVVNAQNKPMMFCRCTRKYYDNVRDGGSEFFGGVDWIESNGSSYIDTGYIEPDDATITIDYSMRFRQKGIPNAIFGASSGGVYNNCICLISENTTYLYMYFANGSNGLSSIENPYYLFNFSHTGQNYIIQRNDIAPFTSSRGTTIYNGRPIYLMALNSNGTATSIGDNINYEFFTIKEIANDVETVKLNLEPIVLSDGTGAMFDSVSGTIKGNSGTGTIKWGIKNIYEIDTSTAGSEFLKNGYFDSICKLISFSQTSGNFGLLCIPCQQYLTYSVKKDIASNRYRIMNIFEYPENNVVGDNFISVDVAKTLYENYTTSKDATFLLSWIYNKQYDGEIPSKCWVIKNEEV